VRGWPSPVWPLLRVVALLGALCASVTAVHAQSEVAVDQGQWTPFGTTSGLPSSRVLAVTVGADGRPWAGTDRGVAWFDGYRWRPVALPSWLLDWNVKGLSALDDGRILVRRTLAPDLLVGDTSGFIPVAVDVASRVVEMDEAQPSGDGSLYVVGGGLLLRVDPRSSRIDTAWTLPDSVQSRLLGGNRDGAWVTTPEGIFFSTEAGWVVRHAAEGGPLWYRSVDVRADGTGAAWIQEPTSSRGVWHWDDSGTLTRLNEGREVVFLLAAGPEASVAAVYGSGTLRVWKAGRWSETALPPGTAEALALGWSPEGDLWVGTERGILRHRDAPPPWVHRDLRSSDRNYVNEILPMSDGSVWLGTIDGLVVHHVDGSETLIPRVLGVSLGVVTGLAEDAEGGIWVASGASFSGSFRLFQGSWRHYGAGDGLTAHRIHKIRADRAGRLWFLGLAGESGGGGQEAPGAFLLEDGRFVRHGPDEGLVDGRVYDFDEDPGGAFWFATTGGISRLKEGSWSHWTKANGLRTERIFALAADPETGSVWFSDQKNGVGILEPTSGRISYLPTGGGPASDEIWQLLLDGTGGLWVSSAGGLFHLRDGIWTTFPPDGGPRALHLWPLAMSGSRLFVGSRGSGMSVLDLDALPARPPAVVVEEPLVDRENVVLRWAAYAPDGVVAPETVETRHRIDGGPWSSWGVDRETSVRVDSGRSHRLDLQARWLRAASAPCYP